MSLGPLAPYALPLVLLLALVVLVLLVLLIWKSMAKETIPAGPEDVPEPELADEELEQGAVAATDQILINAAFERAAAEMRVRSDRNVYGSALHMVIGAEGSREPNFLLERWGSGLDLAIDDPVRQGLAFGNGCGFFFFDDRIALDVAGEQVLAADGTSADEAGWKTILTRVGELRPKRPVDGVVLTVSARELSEASRNEAARLSLATRADRLHRRLADVQRELGFRLPVYVLITGAEKLTGFEQLCASLPENARGQILGWSSPHPVQVPYRADWLDEAFEELHRDLGNLQMSLFAGETRADGVLLFPWQVRGLQQPLRTFLNHVFKTSAHQEGMILRGFYLCGEALGKTAFVTELLEQKVFPESGLAMPTSRTKMARDRKVRALQLATAAAAVILFGGLLWARWSFKQQNAVLEPLLKKSNEAIVELSSAGSREDVATKAGEILDQLSKVQFTRYGSVFVPASWFSSFDHDLREALSITFSTVILDSIRTKLEEKVRLTVDEATSRIEDQSLGQEGLGTTRYVRPSLASAQVVPITEMPEFIRFQQFVAKLREIEARGRTLNALSEPSRGELRELGELVEYAFGHKLSDRFFRRAGLYEHALGDAKTFERFTPLDFQAQTNTTARELATDFFDALYGSNAFAARIEQLTTALDPASLDWKTHGESDTERFRRLSLGLREVERDLSGPELQWAFEPQFDLGTPYQNTIHAMRKSQFFHPESADAIEMLGKAGWARFTQNITRPSALVGPVLTVRDDRPEMKLSSDALLLQSALDTFLNQGFVASPARGGSLVTKLPPDQRLMWDTRRLEQAGAVYQAYERFRERGLRLFSSLDVQSTIDTAARQQVAVQMRDLIAGAQIIESAPLPESTSMLEQELHSDVDRFAAAVGPVKENLAIFGQLDRFDERKALASATTSEAVRLLVMADELLRRNAPYTPTGDFAAWDGKTPPSPRIWDAKDAAELAAYLAAARTRVSRIGAYVKPVLDWLTASGMDDLPEAAPRVTFWQSILDDLAEYDAKKPGNAVAALEEYIGGTMAKVTTRDCGDAEVKAMPQRVGGFYGAKLNNIARGVQARCWVSAKRDAAQEYAQLAQFFRQRLAGRYPFSEGGPESGDVEASPEDIRQFYRRFDASAALLRSLPSDSAFGSSQRGPKKFIEEMRAVRVFFAPFLDAPKPQRAPTIQVEPEFRTLKRTSLEVGGGEILRWSLTVGNETLTEREKGKKLSWTPGEPVRLSLRWATDADYVPVLREARRGMSVVDGTVSYDYKNQWALLSAMKDLHAAREDLGNADALPVTLAFYVDTKPAEGRTVEPRTARVFMRLSLLTPEGAPVELPHFPSKAAELETLMVEDEP